MTDLKLRSWRRSTLYDSAQGPLVDGRFEVSIPLTLQNTIDNQDSVSDDIKVVLASAKDVEPLNDSDVLAVAPTKGSRGAETTKAAHIEFRDSDLPWRYSPKLESGGRVTPWMALLVGTSDEITVADNTVLVELAVLNDHDLTQSDRWAHVDESEGRNISRLLSPRQLLPQKNYLACLIPTFDDNGNRSWTVPEQNPMALPLLYFWRFSTDEAGDFISLATQLAPRIAPAELGQTQLSYDRVDPHETLPTYGAMAPVGVVESPVSDAVHDDLDQYLDILGNDEDGRPIIGLPDYGRDWIAPGATTTWSERMNHDPRYRVAGGLGRKAGIQLQQKISDEAVKQAGDIDLSHRLIANASFGVSTTQSLFSRRLPSDEMSRLWLLGPASRKVATKDGSVFDRLSASHRPAPATLFSSSAARRLFRSGGVLGRRSGRKFLNPADILRQSNVCLSPPPKAPEGLPHADHLIDFDQVIKQNEKNRTDYQPLIRHLKDLDLGGLPLQIKMQVKNVQEQLITLANSHLDLPFSGLVDLLNLFETKNHHHSTPFRERLTNQLKSFDHLADGKDLSILGTKLNKEPAAPPCQTSDLSVLSKGLVNAFDPLSTQSGVLKRIGQKILGLSGPTLRPLRYCPEIDLPLWRWIRDQASDWLIPGAQALKPNDVTALATNPRFVDAFMLGVNRQALAEFRWRNIRVSARCTPLKRFWDLLEPDSGQPLDTITPIRTWTESSELGSLTHQPENAGVTDLVLVFKSPLFERYPGTIVYLLEAPTTAAGDPDFTKAHLDIDKPKVFPSFQGKFGKDVTFYGFDISPAECSRYWAVLEEAVTGFRFRTVTASTWSNTRKTAFNNARGGNNVSGAVYSRDTFDDPVRALIQGSTLIPEDV